MTELKGDDQLGETATDLLEAGEDLQAIEDQEPGFFKNIGNLSEKALEAMWTLMKVAEIELKDKLIELGVTFKEDNSKYQAEEQHRRFITGTKLMASPDFDGELKEITLPSDREFTISVQDIYTMLYGRCCLKVGTQEVCWVPIRQVLGHR